SPTTAVSPLGLGELTRSATPGGEGELTPDATPDGEGDDKNKGEAGFPTVAPVTADRVQEIAGTMTRESFPRIDGSTATIPISEAVYCLATGEDAEAAKKVINHTKTTNSYIRLYDGEADLLIVYEPSPSIIERMQKEPLTIKPIGLDALVFMANAANPVESLSKQQLIDIYSGKISDWLEVGGKKQELLAFQRPAGSGSQTLMQKLVMGSTAMAKGDNIYHYYTMADILEGMLNYTGDDNTLGYSVYYYASQMYHLPDLKFMAVDGVLPSTQTIYDGTYPYANAFYAVIRPDEPKDSAAHQIFDWLTGQEGQRMVLDLGYVPVIMPEGAEIGKESHNAGSAAEIELLPAEELEEGQHYIFFQKQNISWEYEYGKVIVFDNKWEKCTTFYNAQTSARGVWDGRYLAIGQYRSLPDGQEEFISRIYDLETQRFLDDAWLEGAWLFDSELGYFGKYPSEEEKDARMEIDGEYNEWGKICNARGEIVLNYVPMYEGGMQLYREDDVFRLYDITYRRNEEGSYEAFRYYMIYDLNLHLKLVVFEDEDMLPMKGDREEGAVYARWEDCLFSGKGEILLDKTGFLSRFGDGEDMDCIMEDCGEAKDALNCPVATRLYPFLYKGKRYYVNQTLDFCFVEGEEKGGRTGEGQAPLPYYFEAEGAGWEGQSLYFRADGELLSMKDGTMPDRVLSSGEGYALVHIGENGVVVEEHLPKIGFCETYTYPAPVNPEDRYVYELYYFGEHRFVIKDYQRLSDNTQGTDMELCFYRGMEREDSFTAKSIDLWEQYGRNHNKNETILFVLDDYIVLQLETNEIYQRRYVLLLDGEIRFVTPPCEIGNIADGYAQFRVGNYDTVYDMEGNIVLRALNRALEND
nr:substrate-binding domain-containing protein [Lachnospiraceae bacterium]